jgi:CheY-like chemotaxis protein
MAKRILIADDSPFVREQFRSLIQERTGAEVYEAVNGEEAVQKSAEVHPDVVILDCRMPVMDGLAAARELHRAMPRIPLAMFALEANSFLAEAAQQIGVNALFSKMNWLPLLHWIDWQLANQPSPTAA